MVAFPTSLSMESSNQVKKMGGGIKTMCEQTKAKVVETAKEAKKIGKDDPRKVVHSMKVGLALTIVSLLYYFRPLYDGFGQAGMWAVLTVVVVFEYTVGGTLSKSLNRGFATLVAGALGVGAEYLANLGGKKGEPIILGLLVFTLAAVSTFTRFFPNIKRRYDYGVLIFILTFSLVVVSGFRVDQIIALAHQRLSTILVGAATCMIISLFVFPVWAGEDLHNTVASNIEKLAGFLEGFGSAFFSIPGVENEVASKDDKSLLQGYKIVLNTKATEESLANFAWWEPAHGGFRFRHPWKLYLKIGGIARECACQMEALNGYINSKPQVASEFYITIQPACMRISSECSKSLRALASAITKMTHPSKVEQHIQNSKSAASELKRILESFSEAKTILQEIMPVLVVASILDDIIKSVEQISELIHELSDEANFKNVKSTVTPEKHLLHRGIVKPVDDTGSGHIVVTIHGMPNDSPENKNPGG